MAKIVEELVARGNDILVSPCCLWNILSFPAISYYLHIYMRTFLCRNDQPDSLTTTSRPQHIASLCWVIASDTTRSGTD